MSDVIVAMNAATNSILRSTQSIANRASQISRWNQDAASTDQNLAKNFVEIEIEKTAIRANTRVIEVSADLFRELANIGR